MVNPYATFGMSYHYNEFQIEPFEICEVPWGGQATPVVISSHCKVGGGTWQDAVSGTTYTDRMIKFYYIDKEIQDDPRVVERYWANDTFVKGGPYITPEMVSEALGVNDVDTYFTPGNVPAEQLSLYEEHATRDNEWVFVPEKEEFTLIDLDGPEAGPLPLGRDVDFIIGGENRA